MSEVVFFATIAAVLAGNALTAVWAYYFWRIGKEAIEDIPAIIHLSCGVVPPAVMAAGAYFMVG
jgi:hypothetical protein